MGADDLDDVRKSLRVLRQRGAQLFSERIAARPPARDTLIAVGKTSSTTGLLTSSLGEPCAASPALTARISEAQVGQTPRSCSCWTAAGAVCNTTSGKSSYDGSSNSSAAAHDGLRLVLGEHSRGMQIHGGGGRDFTVPAREPEGAAADRTEILKFCSERCVSRPKVSAGLDVANVSSRSMRHGDFVTAEPSIDKGRLKAREGPP